MSRAEHPVCHHRFFCNCWLYPARGRSQHYGPNRHHESFEDSGGRRVLRERRLSRDELEQKDRLTKELDDILRSNVVNRTGTARIEISFTDRGVVAGKPEDVRTEIIQQVVNGQDTGLQETFVAGRKMQELTLLDGSPHGTERQYWFTSQLALIGSWKEGRQNGNWFAYYVNGKLGHQWQMKDGMAEGRAVSWSPEGQKVADGVFRGGSPYDGTFIGPGGFDRRVLVQTPSQVYMPAGTYKLVSYRRGIKIEEKPLDIPFSKSELDPWEELRASVNAGKTSLPQPPSETNATR